MNDLRNVTLLAGFASIVTEARPALRHRRMRLSDVFGLHTHTEGHSGLVAVRVQGPVSDRNAVGLKRYGIQRVGLGVVQKLDEHGVTPNLSFSSVAPPAPSRAGKEMADLRRR